MPLCGNHYPEYLQCIANHNVLNFFTDMLKILTPKYGNTTRLML